jgi:hypothetical protein
MLFALFSHLKISLAGYFSTYALGFGVLYLPAIIPLLSYYNIFIWIESIGVLEYRSLYACLLNTGLWSAIFILIGTTTAKIMGERREDKLRRCPIK